MYQFGTIHIDEEMQEQIQSNGDPIQALKDAGLLVVVQKQDFGWAQIDPPLPWFAVADEGQALTAEGDETEVHDHPVVEGTPGGFNNLG
jgi:hypothetical protein